MFLCYKAAAKNRPWLQIPDTPQARNIAKKQGAMFFTWNSFKDNGQRFGDLPLDFDSTDPGEALKDVRALLFHLTELHEVDPYSIQFFMSGSKGFHVVIPSELFNAQAGDLYLPLIYKKIASDWKERFNLPTLDLSLYCMGKGKMFRIANVKRSNGKFKVRVTLEEVQGSIDDLIPLSENPREIEAVDFDLELVPDLAELFQQYKVSVYKEIESRKTAAAATASVLPKTIPACISYILSESPKTDNTTFNKLVMNLINYFQGAGYDYEAAFEVIHKFVANYTHSTEYITPEKRLKHFEDQWKYLNKKDYGFDYNYLKGMSFPGSAFDCRKCNLNSKEIPQEKAPDTGTIPTENEQILDFPDIMAGTAGQFARLYGEHLEAPQHFFYMSFLTCLGSILSERLTLATEIQPQPRFYTILLGESADDRKSTAIDKTVSFFRDALESFAVCRGVGSAEGLQKRLQKTSALLLCLDEFRQFVGKCKIEASVLLPCVNSLYEANSYESSTKKTDINLDGVHLSILAASTIQTYERTWDSSFTDIGFNNRLFLVPGSGHKKHSFPVKVPDKEIASLKIGLQKILIHAKEYPELDLTEDAKNLYHNWYLNLESSIHSKRLDTYALRLMALLAVNELKPVVDDEIISKTLAICDWQLEARQLHDPIDADNATAKMEEKIRRLLTKKERTDRELKQYTNANKTGLWVFERAKNNLIKAHEIQWIKKEKLWVKTKV